MIRAMRNLLWVNRAVNIVSVNRYAISHNMDSQLRNDEEAYIRNNILRAGY